MFLSVKTDSLSVKRHIKAQNFRAQEATPECSMYALSLISQKEDILPPVVLLLLYNNTINYVFIYWFIDSSRIYWALALCDAPKKMPHWNMNSALGELAVLTSAWHVGRAQHTKEGGINSAGGAKPWRVRYTSGQWAFQPGRTMWGKARDMKMCLEKLCGESSTFTLLILVISREFCSVIHKPH